MPQPILDKFLLEDKRWVLWALPGLMLLLMGAWFASRSPNLALSEQHRISQRGREFWPHALNIRQGDVVRIANDDEDLSHHAYVSSARFKFDSGDQGPGHDVDIQFTQSGTYSVLCGIHPKMRLSVQVRQH